MAQGEVQARTAPVGGRSGPVLPPARRQRVFPVCLAGEFHPRRSPFPISAPWDYAGELETSLGTYYTAGMVEDHTGLLNGRIDEDRVSCPVRDRDAGAQRNAGARAGQVSGGTSSSVCSILPTGCSIFSGGFGSPIIPPTGTGLTRGYRTPSRNTIALRQRRRAGLRRAERRDAGDRAQRSWLHQLPSRRASQRMAPSQGLLVLRRTRAREREPGVLSRGGLEPDQRLRPGTWGDLPQPPGSGGTGHALPGGCRSDRGGHRADSPRSETGDRRAPVRGVKRREEIYSGDYTAEAPDLLVLFERGYRASWTTSLGGTGEGISRTTPALGRRPHRGPGPGSWSALHEPSLSCRGAAPAGSGADDSGGLGVPKGDGHGRNDSWDEAARHRAGLRRPGAAAGR